MKKTILPLYGFLLFTLGCELENAVAPAESVHGIDKNVSNTVENQRVNFSAIIPLPNGFNPEGIVAGKGNDLFVGSLFHGGIYKADSRTGSGSLVVEPQGRRAVGLDFDFRTNYLFVAGGPDGFAYNL